jgi:hypothetical protein
MLEAVSLRLKKPDPPTSEDMVTSQDIVPFRDVDRSTSSRKKDPLGNSNDAAVQTDTPAPAGRRFVSATRPRRLVESKFQQPKQRICTTLTTHQVGLKPIPEVTILPEVANEDIDISFLPDNGDESWQFSRTEPLLESTLATSGNEYKLLLADHAENPWLFDRVKGKDTAVHHVQVKIPSDDPEDSSKRKYRCVAAKEMDTDDL